jgi:hypothetical protein
MSSGSSVCKATLADVPRLAQALASAFQDDPVITWVLPDEQRRRVVLVAFMEFRPRNLAFPHDEVWMIQDGAAAAAWVPPPGRWQMSLAQRVGLLLPLIRFLRLRTPTVLGGSAVWKRVIRTSRSTGICSSSAASRRHRDED